MGDRYLWEKSPIEIEVSMSNTIAMIFAYQSRIPEDWKDNI